MDPPTSEHRSQKSPGTRVRLLKRPTSGNNVDLPSTQSRSQAMDSAAGSGDLSSKIGAPIIRRLSARSNERSTNERTNDNSPHLRRKETEKTRITGQTRPSRQQTGFEAFSKVDIPVVSPAKEDTVPPLLSLDFSDHQWPSIGGTTAVAEESGWGKGAWLSAQGGTGWSSVVKSAPSRKTLLLRSGPATITVEDGDSSSGGEGEVGANGGEAGVKQANKKKRKKKKSGNVQQPPQERKLDKSPQLDIFQYAKQSPVRPVLNRKETKTSIKEVPTPSKNMLDSTAPVARRGKEREQPKAKKPTYLRKVIEKEKAMKRELREKGLDIPPDLDVMKSPTDQSDLDNAQASTDCESSTNQSSLTTPTSEATTAPLTTPTSEANTAPLATPTSESNSQCLTTPTSEANPEPLTTPTATPTSEANPAPLTTPTLIHSHTTPPSSAPTTSKRQIHNRKFREYCSHVVTEEINSVVEQLLQDLVRFQDRAYQKDPNKAKSKRRYVCGLREVYKHLEVGKLKCVIIPPNLDHIQSTGGIDERVSAILSLCEEKEVQVVYAMSRRRLATVLKKTFKIGCVGIFSYDGAEAHYRKMKELVEEASTLYTRIAHPKPPVRPTETEISATAEPLLSESASDHDSEGQDLVQEPKEESGTQKMTADVLWDRYLPKKEKERKKSNSQTDRTFGRCNDDVAAISTNQSTALENGVTLCRRKTTASATTDNRPCDTADTALIVSEETLSTPDSYLLNHREDQEFQWNIDAAEFVPSHTAHWSPQSSSSVAVL